MTPAEATEAMEIIEMMTKYKSAVLSIHSEPKGAYLVETLKDARYKQYPAPTLLGALRKAKAAWEEGK